MVPEDDGPEALDWLRRSRNPAALAPERFRSTGEAIAFVELLYTAGASRVVVPTRFIRDDPPTVEGEGGPRASGLMVYLPDAAAGREPLVWLCGWELGAGYMLSNPDTLAAYVGRRAVFLGWTGLPPRMPPLAVEAAAAVPEAGAPSEKNGPA